MFGVGCLDGRLGEVGVQLDLVHRRDDVGRRQQLLQVVRHEVADTDRPHPPVGQQGLQRLVRGDGLVEAVGGGLMQDEQVQVVDAELADRLLPGVQRLVVPVVADPDLGLDEHVGTVEARVADALADLPLVAVRRGGVDVPVAGRQRRLDGRRRLLRRALEDAQSEGGHRDAVIESKFHVHAFHGIQVCGIVGGHVSTPFSDVDRSAGGLGQGCGCGPERCPGPAGGQISGQDEGRGDSQGQEQEDTARGEGSADLRGQVRCGRAGGGRGAHEDDAPIRKLGGRIG